MCAKEDKGNGEECTAEISLMYTQISSAYIAPLLDLSHESSSFFYICHHGLLESFEKLGPLSLSCLSSPPTPLFLSIYNLFAE